MSKKNEYYKEYMLRRYHRRRAEAIIQLGGRCVHCGAIEDLDFDHIDPELKSFTIGAELAGIAEAKLQEELRKCQLLCKDCHVKKTRVDMSYGQIRTHGTPTSYSYFKCRCDLCVTAYRQYRRVRRGLAPDELSRYHPAKGLHGTKSSYRYCHCDLCKAANTAAMREYKARKKIGVSTTG